MFVPVPVTVVELSVLEDVSLPVAGPEFIAVLPLEPGLAWEVVAVDNVSVTLELAVPIGLVVVVVEVPALLEFADEPLLLVGIGAVELGELPLMVLEVPIDIDGVVLIVLSVLSGGMEISIVVTPEAVSLDAPREEETPNPVAVDAPKSDGPDGVITVVTPLVTAEVVEIVRSVVAEPVPADIADEKEEFPGIGLCIVKKIVEVVPETGVVVPLGMVATDVELLDTMPVLLTGDPERELEDMDPPEELVDAVKLLLLLGGGSVYAG
ncbi:hypothetical protein GGR55DRAFT_679885 [Xylaria sp. FL0064]|nr:hypothetical protein GGR55DRAFT_679885 [Xylaria sp. FL0064]